MSDSPTILENITWQTHKQAISCQSWQLEHDPTQLLVRDQQPAYQSRFGEDQPVSSQGKNNHEPAMINPVNNWGEERCYQ